MREDLLSVLRRRLQRYRKLGGAGPHAHPVARTQGCTAIADQFSFISQPGWRHERSLAETCRFPPVAEVAQADADVLAALPNFHIVAVEVINAGIPVNLHTFLNNCRVGSGPMKPLHDGLIPDAVAIV